MDKQFIKLVALATAVIFNPSEGLYGSEIWAYENNDIIEKPHLRYCKYTLSVNKSTTSSMVYGELGRYPLNTHQDVFYFGHVLFQA